MKLTYQETNELTNLLLANKTNISSLLALSAIYCTNCHGCGRLWPSRRICPCVFRRLARELSSLTDKWEQLWLKAKWFPHYFPPNPVVRSSLVKYGNS